MAAGVRSRPPVLRLVGSALVNDQVIVRDVNLTLHEGSAMLLTGRNASGKSSFLRLGSLSASSSFSCRKGSIKKALTVHENVRKRLQLARMLAIHRPLWLLDEPSVGLDTKGGRGGMVVVATHVPINLPDAMHLRFPPRVSQFRQYNAGDFE